MCPRTIPQEEEGSLREKIAPEREKVVRGEVVTEGRQRRLSVQDGVGESRARKRTATKTVGRAPLNPNRGAPGQSLRQ